MDTSKLVVGNRYVLSDEDGKKIHGFNNEGPRDIPITAPSGTVVKYAGTAPDDHYRFNFETPIEGHRYIDVRPGTVGRNVEPKD